jgi:hypothetical protein
MTIRIDRELGRFTCHHTDHGRLNSKWFHGRAVRAFPCWVDFDQLIHVEVVGRGDLRWHMSCWVANWTIGNFCKIDKVMNTMSCCGDVAISTAASLDSIAHHLTDSTFGSRKRPMAGDWWEEATHGTNAVVGMELVGTSVYNHRGSS